MKIHKEIHYGEVVGMTPTPHCYDAQLHTEKASKFGEYTDLRIFKKCGSEPEPSPEPVPERDYLAFVALEDGTFSFTNDIQYSLDDGVSWTTLASGGNTDTVTAGSKILFKATLTPSTSYPNYGIGKFSSTGRFNVEGNAMSLSYGDNFIGQISLSGGHAFYGLFSGCTNLVSAENLSLPATTLAESCYYGMFQGCTSLTTAPELPATTLADYCYQYMFYGCTSLTIAPSILPATTLEQSCYCGMFQCCTSLTAAPKLPATTLAESCYYLMFSDCTSLTIAPSILPATTLEQSCYCGMFQYCTSLTAAPELPATTLADFCYASMFNSCTRLNYIKCLATNISAGDCTYNWVYGVALSGTFVKAASMDDWTTGVNGIPSGWSTQNV